MSLSKCGAFFCLWAFFAIFSCSDSLKEPPGKIYGTVTLIPDPGLGENWADLRASSEIAEYETISDPQTLKFAFENLKVENLLTKYYLQAERAGYISYGDSISVEAGVTISNFNIVLRHGLRQDTLFQNGIYPSSAYNGCADTYISFPDTQAVHGALPVMVVSGNAPDAANRGLIHFVFDWRSYFPAAETIPSEIESAVLSLYVDSVLTTGSVAFNVFNLEHQFDENLASWTHNGPDPWPGGSGGSWGNASSDTISVGGLTTGWVHFSIKRIAENWLNDRYSGPMIIKLTDESRPSSIFIRTAQSDSTALYPKLRIAVVYPQ